MYGFFFHFLRFFSKVVVCEPPADNGEIKCDGANNDKKSFNSRRVKFVA